MDNLVSAQEWIRIAEMDFKSAEYLVKMYPVPIEIICFLCQQAAEKYLKSYLVLRKKTPPKIHDLNELCKLCIKLSEQFRVVADHCSELTVYGVQPRYPMEMMLEEQDMQYALTGAKAIQEFVLSLVQELISKDEGRDNQA